MITLLPDHRLKCACGRCKACVKREQYRAKRQERIAAGNHPILLTKKSPEPMAFSDWAAGRRALRG